MIAPQSVSVSTSGTLRPESQKTLRHTARPASIWPSATECALQENRQQSRVAPAGGGTRFEKAGYEIVASRLASQRAGATEPAAREGKLADAAWSVMRARLSALPSTTSTSKMPGEVVRPVSAARKG